jgi:ubiquinone biosynthesis protein
MDFGMVGHQRDRVRRDLLRLCLVSVALDADGIVDQLIHMGAAGADVDRTGWVRDISRLLNKYYVLQLKDIRARDVVDEIMPIAFNYHLRLPSDLWLLGKTLGMLEGIGLQLYPEFDIFAVAQPFVRRLVWHTVTPDADWARTALMDSASWGDMLRRLPRAGDRVLERIERDELFQLSLKDSDRMLHRLDRFSARLSLSILVGALIIGLAILLPRLSLTGWGRWVVIGTAVVTIILGAGLAVSYFRSNQNH